MKKLLQVLLPVALVLQLSGNATAQTIPFKLDSMLSRTLDSMHTILNNKGMGAAVQIPSGAIWAGGAGVSSENPLVPINADHIFGIGSISKTITAATILQLADEGVLSLGDSLHEWLDTFAFVNPNITIRQLLRHQSGIYNYTANADFFPLLNAYPDSIWTLENIVKTFVKAPLFQPGASWSYCNTNYALLGLIIKEATGNPYYLESRDRFVEPLGLSSVVLPPYEAFPPNIAHAWLDLNGDNIVDDADVFFSNWNAWYSTAGPAGAYFSTPSDMVRWMRTYMSGTLLSPAMMAELKTTVTTPMPGGTKYGLGIMERNIQGQKGYGHGGDAAYSASVWYFPNKDVSISVLNNDGQKSSTTLIPTVAALLKTYLDFEQQVTDRDR